MKTEHRVDINTLFYRQAREGLEMDSHTQAESELIQPCSPSASHFRNKTWLCSCREVSVSCGKAPSPQSHRSCTHLLQDPYHPTPALLSSLLRQPLGPRAWNFTFSNEIKLWVAESVSLLQVQHKMTPIPNTTTVEIQKLPTFQ